VPQVGPRARKVSRADRRGIAGIVIIIVPVILTELLALRSNRPEFSFIEAGKGSLHWTHLLSLVFADLFRAMDPKSTSGAPALCVERTLRPWPTCSSPRT